MLGFSLKNEPKLSVHSSPTQSLKNARDSLCLVALKIDSVFPDF